MKRIYTTMLLALLCAGNMLAANIKVYMNTKSKTMTFADKTTGTLVETGAPDKKNTYEFDAPAGTYVLTAYATDGETVNGTIELNVTEDDGQEFKVLTCDAYADRKSTRLNSSHQD